MLIVRFSGTSFAGLFIPVLSFLVVHLVFNWSALFAYFSAAHHRVNHGFVGSARQYSSRQAYRHSAHDYCVVLSSQLRFWQIHFATSNDLEARGCGRSFAPATLFAGEMALQLSAEA
ncbi:hypothetical protein C8F01DRAFT_376555 [Mycena amicta]|nr:hypothetical protein C8F01DRAFT_376555 [Mycena amicta]